MKTFTPPRTADGVPNIQGSWDRAYTSQDIEEHGADQFNIGPARASSSTRRIGSPYQPWAMALKKDMVARYISPLAACLPPGVPRYAIAPGPHEVIQTPGYVVHLLEFSHSHRIIPTTAQPHVGSAIRL